MLSYVFITNKKITRRDFIAWKATFVFGLSYEDYLFKIHCLKLQYSTAKRILHIWELAKGLIGKHKTSSYTNKRLKSRFTDAMQTICTAL